MQNCVDDLFKVCTFALRSQDRASEIGNTPLHQMPFFLAIKKAKGAVLVLDPQAVYFTRIWW